MTSWGNNTQIIDHNSLTFVLISNVIISPINKRTTSTLFIHQSAVFMSNAVVIGKYSTWSNSQQIMLPCAKILTKSRKFTIRFQSRDFTLQTYWCCDMILWYLLFHDIRFSHISFQIDEMIIHSDITPLKSSSTVTTLPWWHHQMETFSALLAICAGDSPVTGEYPGQRPVTRSFQLWCFLWFAPE